jgi:hypothetical protein
MKTYGDNRWRWVVSFAPQPLYPKGKSPRYPLDRRLGGSQSRSGGCVEEKNLTPAGNRNPAVQPIARRYPDTFTYYWLKTDLFAVRKSTQVAIRVRNSSSYFWPLCGNECGYRYDKIFGPVDTDQSRPGGTATAGRERRVSKAAHPNSMGHPLHGLSTVVQASSDGRPPNCSRVEFALLQWESSLPLQRDDRQDPFGSMDLAALLLAVSYYRLAPSGLM